MRTLVTPGNIAYLYVMQRLTTLLLLAGITFTVQAQTNCGLLHDSNANGFVDIEDFLSILGLFGDQDSDGDGVYDSLDNCIDLEACNFMEIDAELCSYPDAIGDCNGNCPLDADGDGVCDFNCGFPINYQGYNYATVQIGEAREDQRVSAGQRVQHAMVVELSPATLVPIGVQRDNDTDVGALIMVPGAFLFVFGIVVCDLDRGDVVTVALIQTVEDRVQHVLNDEPHITVQLRDVIAQNDLGNLSQLVLILVHLEHDLTFHVLDLLHQHLAKLTTKERHAIDIRKNFFAQLLSWGARHTVDAFLSAILRDDRNSLLHSLIERLVYKPMRLH